MGRPKLEIDAEEVYKLSKYHITIAEMSDFFGCSRDTIERRFAAEIAKGRADGKISLRKAQMHAALKENGNIAMMIWLGKNILGQTDKIDLDQKVTNVSEHQEEVRTLTEHLMKLTGVQLPTK